MRLFFSKAVIVLAVIKNLLVKKIDGSGFSSSHVGLATKI
jgi:hypothetical protein